MHDEWNEKWRVYNDQHYLIEYIKRAENHKEYLRRQEQRKKEIEEKEKAKVVKEARSAFADQIESCVWLIDYFQGQTKVTAPSQPIQANVTQNKEEELKKTQLKVIPKKQEDSFFPISTGETKKKDKKEKVSKREQENEKGGKIELDIKIVREFSIVKINPPVLKSEFAKTLKQLETKLEELKKLTQEEKGKLEEETKKKVEEEKKSSTTTTSTTTNVGANVNVSSKVGLKV